MNQNNVIAIDLAKNVFDACVVDKAGKVLSEKTIQRRHLAKYLSKQAPALVAMEACAGAHYWSRVAQAQGHQVILLPAKFVTAFRQGHKTDANDALAIAIACRQPKVKGVAVKTIEQQDLQSCRRVYEHLSQQRTAVSNMLRGLLAEFGIVFGKGFSQLKRQVPCILEDAENDLPFSFRETLHLAWQHWQGLEEELKACEKMLQNRVNQHTHCRELMQLEGVGPMNALGLYVTLGDGSSFKNGRCAAACIGVTPKQSSSGGVVHMKGIGKKTGCKALRSSLIQGAQAVITALDKRPPRSEKERWLKSVIERRGRGRAAVALANKTVRTAWAMLKYNQPYQLIVS
jgi:transposase